MDRMFLNTVKCKCGKYVMCMVGKHKDGDIIEHNECDLNGN